MQSDPSSPPAKPLATTHFCSVLVALSITDISYKWNHLINIRPFMSDFFHFGCFWGSSCVSTFCTWGLRNLFNLSVIGGWQHLALGLLGGNRSYRHIDLCFSWNSGSSLPGILIICRFIFHHLLGLIPLCSCRAWDVASPHSFICWRNNSQTPECWALSSVLNKSPCQGRVSWGSTEGDAWALALSWQQETQPPKAKFTKPGILGRKLPIREDSLKVPFN